MVLRSASALPEKVTPSTMPNTTLQALFRLYGGPDGNVRVEILGKISRNDGRSNKVPKGSVERLIAIQVLRLTIGEGTGVV